MISNFICMRPTRILTVVSYYPHNCPLSPIHLTTGQSNFIPIVVFFYANQFIAVKYLLEPDWFNTK